jgi:ribonuclease HI
LRSESGEIIGEIASGIGLATNNVAEYTALIQGLQMALDAGVTDIDVCFDSPVLAGHLLKGTRSRRIIFARWSHAYASFLASSRRRRSFACRAH